MLSGIRSLFRAKDTSRDALNKMGRIVSGYSMTRMVYERGLEEDQRAVGTLYKSLGVWLFAGPAETISIDSGIPAITKDLRTGGLGILSLIPVMTETVVVAVPDNEDSWTFLECEIRHKKVAPGGWFQMGMQVTRDVCLDVETMVAFQRRCTKVMNAANPQPA